MAILVVGLLSTAFGFVSDSNLAPSDDVAKVMPMGNHDVIANIESALNDDKIFDFTSSSLVLSPMSYSVETVYPCDKVYPIIQRDARLDDKVPIVTGNTLSNRIKFNMLC